MKNQEDFKQITTIQNGKFRILSPGKPSTLETPPKESRFSLKSVPDPNTTPDPKQKKKNKKEKQEGTKKKAKVKRAKIILIDAPVDTNNVIERRLNVTRESQDSNMKIVDERNTAVSQDFFRIKEGNYYESASTDNLFQLPSKYYNNMDEAVK